MERQLIEQVKPQHLGFGWASRLQRKRVSYFITLDKRVATGSGLRKGDVLYSYLCEDENGRSIIVTYLDLNPRRRPNEK